MNGVSNLRPIFQNVVVLLVSDEREMFFGELRLAVLRRRHADTQMNPVAPNLLFGMAFDQCECQIDIFFGQVEFSEKTVNSVA